jgi:N-carbamoyl-L-amino-acid hydrolase
LRRDALFAATFVMQEVIRIGRDFGPAGRGTVGMVQAHPNSRNVIPGQVTFTVDLRHEDETTLALMDQRLRDACQALAGGAGAGYPVKVDLAAVQAFAPTPFDAAMVATVREQALRLGYSHRDIITGAGHDAVYMARKTPTAMIFVPCKGGISHNEIEDADPRHLEAGANVLLGAMLRVAGVADA